MSTGTAGPQAQAFLERVRSALGRAAGPPEADSATHLFQSADQVAAEAESVRRDMRERADELLDAIAESAATAGWRVSRVASPEDAADVIARICAGAGIKTALRSDQSVFDAVPVDSVLAGAGVELRLATTDSLGSDGGLRDAAFDVDAGITGVDYAIAETGTVVLHPRRGLSRLVSLAPGRHIAILNRGDVLPSLDELFTLERAAFLDGTIEGSMNLISGPSRTGDIAATIVDGIHGPFEVYLVIVG
ncbi:MAG: lactate utilization protein [Chloroflexi bacterium]|nr:lactate utilization protein [Chloroflexota bacterium]